MNWMLNNWFMVILGIAIFAVVGYSVYVFIKKPTDEQIKMVKEWLLAAVTEAEKTLGSGTGKIKLSYVYNMFIQRFPVLANMVTFEAFSALVDEVLEEFRKLLEQNESLKQYVAGNNDTTK